MTGQAGFCPFAFLSRAPDSLSPRRPLAPWHSSLLLHPVGAQCPRRELMALHTLKWKLSVGTSSSGLCPTHRDPGHRGKDTSLWSWPRLAGSGSLPALPGTVCLSMTRTQSHVSGRMRGVEIRLWDCRRRCQSLVEGVEVLALFAV